MQKKWKNKLLEALEEKVNKFPEHSRESVWMSLFETHSDWMIKAMDKYKVMQTHLETNRINGFYRYMLKKNEVEISDLDKWLAFETYKVRDPSKYDNLSIDVTRWNLPPAVRELIDSEFKNWGVK